MKKLLILHIIRLLRKKRHGQEGALAGIRGAVVPLVALRGAVVIRGRGDSGGNRDIGLNLKAQDNRWSPPAFGL